MAATQWNDKEEEELQGLPLLAQVVYLRCLRKFMNYDTGIVGLPPKAIGYQMMAETCEFVPDNGSTKAPRKPTRNELRGAVRQLQRRGLILLISKPLEQPVYKLPFATFNRASPTSTPEKFEQSSEVGGFYSNEDVQETYKGRTREDVPEKDSSTLIYIDEVRNDKGRTKEIPEGTCIHQRSVLPNLTIPVQINLDENEIKQIPEKGSAWCQFFTKHVRYQFHEVKTVPAMTMFKTWCDAKLSLAEATIAIEAAEHTLGKRPDKPAYYKLFVEQVIKERNAKSRPQGERHHAKTSKRPTAEELAIEQLGGHRVYEHED